MKSPKKNNAVSPLEKPSLNEKLRAKPKKVVERGVRNIVNQLPEEIPHEAATQPGEVEVRLSEADHLPDLLKDGGAEAVSDQGDTHLPSQSEHLPVVEEKADPSALVTAIEGAKEPSTETEADSEPEGEEGLSWTMISAIALGSFAMIGAGAYLLTRDDDKDNKAEDSGRDPQAEPSQAEDAAVEETVAVTGQVTLGPVIQSNGLKVEILTQDNQLITVVPLSAEGKFTVDVPADMQIIKARVIDTSHFPDYVDEASGIPKDLDSTLVAVVAVDSTEAGQTIVANINPLTTLSSRLMGLDEEGNGEGLSIESIMEANREVAKNLLGMEDGDITDYDIKPMIDIHGEVSESNEGGQLLAMISALEEKNDFSTSEVIDRLAKSLGAYEDSTERSKGVKAVLDEGADHLGTKYNLETQSAIISYLDKMTDILDEVAGSTGSPVGNIKPETTGKIISLGEDKTHRFGESSFSFHDGNDGDSLHSVEILRTPADGYLRYDGENVTDSITVKKDDLINLTYKGRKDEAGKSYSVLTYKVSDGELQSGISTLIFDIYAINDAPDMTIEAHFDSLFGEVKQINTNVEGDQNNPDLIALDEGGFLAVWDDDQKSIKAQKFLYVEDFKGEYILVKSGNEFTVNTSETTGGQRLFNPEITADAHGDFAVQWWKYDEDTSTSSRLGFFDENLGRLSDETDLGLEYYTKSIISLKNQFSAVGYIATGFVKGGQNSHFGINLYSETGDFIKTINLSPAYGWGDGEIVLTPLLTGGFAVSFRTVTEEINQIGFAFFDHNGDLIPGTFSLIDSNLKTNEGLEMTSLAQGTLVVMTQEGNDILIQGWLGPTPMFADVVVNESNAINTTDMHIIDLADGGIFILWSLESPRGNKIIGRYFDSMGTALTSEIDIYESGPEVDLGSITVDQLANGRLQLAWSDDSSGSDDIYMTTLNLDKMQHNLVDKVSVAQASAVDVEGSDISFSLKSDANGLFEIDEDSGLISVKDPLGISSSNAMSFDIKVVATDEEGEAAEILHTVKFPGSLQDPDDAVFTLTEDTLDLLSLGDLDELTVQDLIDLGILQTATSSQIAPAQVPSAGPAYSSSNELNLLLTDENYHGDLGNTWAMTQIIG